MRDAVPALGGADHEHDLAARRPPLGSAPRARRPCRGGPPRAACVSSRQTATGRSGSSSGERASVATSRRGDSNATIVSPALREQALAARRACAAGSRRSASARRAGRRRRARSSRRSARAAPRLASIRGEARRARARSRDRRRAACRRLRRARSSRRCASARRARGARAFVVLVQADQRRGDAVRSSSTRVCRVSSQAIASAVAQRVEHAQGHVLRGCRSASGRRAAGRRQPPRGSSRKYRVHPMPSEQDPGRGEPRPRYTRYRARRRLFGEREAEQPQSPRHAAAGERGERPERGARRALRGAGGERGRGGGRGPGQIVAPGRSRAQRFAGGGAGSRSNEPCSA